MTPSVYAIIVTYNAMPWIDRCLSSLTNSTLRPYIVVVDNCSKDGTVEYIRNQYSEVHLIINKENKGFGQANNQGIEYAYEKGASHFFLLNQDAWLTSLDGLQKLVKIQDENNIAVLSPVHLNGTATKFDYSFLKAVMFDENNVSFANDLFFSNNGISFYPVAKVNAASWLLSKKTIEEIGGFDPVFFHYGEDINYCDRLKYHNRVIAFTPSVTICHDRGEHGNMAVYNKREVISFLLCKHSNINHPMLTVRENLMKYTFLLYFNILKCLFTFKWRKMNLLAGSYFEYIKSIPSIYRNRKQNRKIASNWLLMK